MVPLNWIVVSVSGILFEVRVGNLQRPNLQLAGNALQEYDGDEHLLCQLARRPRI